MGYCVIIRGPLGCGKSTIAHRLAKILNAEYVSIDKVLEEHGLDKIEPGAECIPAENFIKANELVLPKVEEKLKNSKIVVFDACFYHKEPIEHLIRNLKYPHYVFTLKAPVEVCIERDRKRGKTHGEDATRAVHKLVGKFDYGTAIDMSKPLDETIAEILSHLPKLRTLK
jgi:shikimate kinase